MNAKKMLLLVSVGLAACGAEGTDDGIGSLEQGLSRPSLASAYWTTLFETPADRNPLVDESLCAFEGTELMLLGGHVVSLDGHIEVRRGPRACRMPAGRPFVLPIATAAIDGANLEQPPSLREMVFDVRDALRQVRHLRVHLDGRDVRALRAPVERSGPSLFGYTLPEDGRLYPVSPGGEDVGPGVADGIFARMPALSRGSHVLVVQGIAGSAPFRVEYRIQAD